MKCNDSVIRLSLLFVLMLIVRPSLAQTPKESSLITHLVREANQPDAHSVGDTYLRVKIGTTEYIAELESGKIVSKQKADVASGGFCSDYVEVTLNLLDKNQQETSQGAGQVLKSGNGNWKMIALSEGDYACGKLKGIPRAVIACLKIECN